MNADHEETIQAVMDSMQGLSGVTAAVMVAQDGRVLAHRASGDPEAEGAVAAYVALAGAKIGETLSMNPMRWAVVTIGQEGVLVVEHGESCIGLFLDAHTSPAMVASRALGALNARKGSP